MIVEIARACERNAQLDGLNIEPRAKLMLPPVHLAAVSFMVVPAKMQEAVEDKLLDLGFEVEAVLACLPLGLFGGDDDVTEVILIGVEFVRLVRERKNVGCRVFAAKKLIELLHPPVGNESDGEGLARPFIIAVREISRECTDRSGIELDLALEVDEADHLFAGVRFV